MCVHRCAVAARGAVNLENVTTREAALGQSRHGTGPSKLIQRRKEHQFEYCVVCCGCW